MNTEQLKEYLSIAADMEKDIYLKQRLINSLQTEIASLGNARPYSPPTPPMLQKTGVISEIIMLILGLAACGYALSLLGKGILATIGGLALLVCVGGPILIGTAIGLGRAMKASDRNSLAKQRYHEESVRYEQNAAADAQRVEEELVRQACCKSELRRIQAQRDQSQALLNNFYSAGVIFPKYRNLVMITSIYEYFCAGRCTTLEGHEGAYNILEMEIRLDRIITQLDQVLVKLDQIQNNQYLLYAAIQDVGRQSARILESTHQMADNIQQLSAQNAAIGASLDARLADLQKNSEFTAYQAERTKLELHYMNRMNYLTGRNDGSFYNIPPA